jgi:hypothetical protein
MTARYESSRFASLAATVTGFDAFARMLLAGAFRARAS